MRDLPKNWGSDRLKDLCAVNSATLSTKTDPDFEFPYLEISNVDYFGIVDDSAIERVRFEDAPSRARRIVFRDSTIISSVRPNLQAIAFFEDPIPELICSTGFNVVEPQQHRLAPRFLYYVLISDYARQYFEAVATGVGYPAVADKDFGALVIPLPPLSEQRRIVDFLNSSCAVVDAVASLQKVGDKAQRIKGVLNRQMEILLAYRKALINECITGKRRVTAKEANRTLTHAYAAGD